MYCRINKITTNIASKLEFVLIRNEEQVVESDLLIEGSKFNIINFKENPTIPLRHQDGDQSTFDDNQLNLYLDGENTAKRIYTLVLSEYEIYVSFNFNGVQVEYSAGKPGIAYSGQPPGLPDHLKSNIITPI